MNKDDSDFGPDESGIGVPMCSTGPLGRLMWTVKELVGIVRRVDCKDGGEPRHPR